MSLLPIVERGRPVACHADWPLSWPAGDGINSVPRVSSRSAGDGINSVPRVTFDYFSRLGLVVSRLAETLAVLQAGGFTVHGDERGHLLEIDHRQQVAAVVHLLATHAITCETADLIGCVYQG